MNLADLIWTNTSNAKGVTSKTFIEPIMEDAFNFAATPGDNDTAAVHGFTGDNTSIFGMPFEAAHSQLTILRYSVLVLYLVTFFFGLVGNSLTILVILKNNKMKTVASCFILNLAVADDLFMLSLPFMAHSTFTHDWVFGSFMCTLMSAFYGVNLYASVFTMVLMSMDRYLAIVHPFRSIRYRTVKKAIIVCIGIWLVCVLIMTPYWLYARTGGEGPDGSRKCQVMWPVTSQLEHKRFWTNFELIIGFVLPIIIMAVCYMELLRHLVKNDGPLQDQTKKPIKRVTIMVFLVTIVFIVCWTPYHILKYTNTQKMRNYIEHRIRPKQSEIINFAIYNTVAQALVFVSSCCNPFIYGISSNNFRRLYAAVVCKCCSTYTTARKGYVLNPRATSYNPARSQNNSGGPTELSTFVGVDSTQNTNLKQLNLGQRERQNYNVRRADDVLAPGLVLTNGRRMAPQKAAECNILSQESIV